jgi:hypothetical protein
MGNVQGVVQVGWGGVGWGGVGWGGVRCVCVWWWWEGGGHLWSAGAERGAARSPFPSPPLPGPAERTCQPEGGYPPPPPAHLQLVVCVVHGAAKAQRQAPLARLLLHRLQVGPAAVHVHRHRLAGAPGVLLQPLQQLGVALGPQHLAQEVGALGPAAVAGSRHGGLLAAHLRRRRQGTGGSPVSLGQPLPSGPRPAGGLPPGASGWRARAQQKPAHSSQHLLLQPLQPAPQQPAPAAAAPYLNQPPLLLPRRTSRKVGLTPCTNMVSWRGSG